MTQDTCPPTLTPQWTYNTDAMPEGIVPVQAKATDIIGNQASSAAWNLQIDRSGPDLAEPTGTLYDHRNQTDDHRNEGLYDNDATLHLTATDGSPTNNATKRSGVKSFQLQIDGQEKARKDFTCPNGQCNNNETWDYTLPTDDLQDGDHTITVSATDLAGNSTSKTWQVTVDRRGDVYHAKQYTGDPGAGGTSDTEEWGQINTLHGRQEEGELISTRDAINCDDNNPAAGQCELFRAVSTDDSSSPSFQTVDENKAKPPADRHIPTAVDIVEPRDPSEQSTGSGAINDAVAPWQTPPPAHGDQYVKYEETISGKSSAEDASAADPDSPVTTHTTIWVDGATHMPLKLTTAVDGDSAAPDTIYYDYGRERLNRPDLPSNFFQVSRPDHPANSQRVDSRGAGAIGSQTDADTGNQFAAFGLGNAPSLPSSFLGCLGTSDIVSMTADDAQIDSVPYDSTWLDNPDGSDGGGPGVASEDDPDPSGPETFVSANYGSVASVADCVPGAKNLDEVPLSVVSMAKSSALARSFKRAYQDYGEGIQTDPTDGDFSRAGVSDTFWNGQTITTYVVPESDGTVAAYFETGNTAIILRGPFSKNDLNNVLGQLEEL